MSIASSKELFEASEKLRKKKKLQKLERSTEGRLQQEKLKLAALRDSLEKEEQDVRRLEKSTLTGLLYSILGSKPGHVEKEKREYLAARVRFDQCRSAVDCLEQEHKRLTEELSSYENAESEYDALLKQKQEFLLTSGHESANTIHSMTSRLADLNGDKKEIEEAIEAGKTAVSILEKVLGLLRDGGTAGTSEYVGGGIMMTSTNYSKIDETAHYVQEAQIALQRLKTELNDIGFEKEINDKIESFEKYADYYFEGLISDYIANQKISDSVNVTYQVMIHINDIFAALDEKLKDVGKELKELQHRLETLVVEA